MIKWIKKSGSGYCFIVHVDEVKNNPPKTQPISAWKQLATYHKAAAHLKYLRWNGARRSLLFQVFQFLSNHDCKYMDIQYSYSPALLIWLWIDLCGKSQSVKWRDTILPFKGVCFVSFYVILHYMAFQYIDEIPGRILPS